MTHPLAGADGVNVPPSPVRFPPAWRLLGRQTRYEIDNHSRSRGLIGLEVALPLSLLVILGYLLRDAPGGSLADSYTEIFVPNMTAVGVVTTCFAGLGVTMATVQLSGTAARLRGTPLPGWVPVSALGLQALAVGMVIGSLCALCGWALLGVSLPDPGPFLVSDSMALGRHEG